MIDPGKKIQRNGSAYFLPNCMRRFERYESYYFTRSEFYGIGPEIRLIG